jgi:HEAT repeat protein
MPTSKTQRRPASPSRHLRPAPEVRKLHQMNGHLQPEILFLFLEICSGDAQRSMEAAKRLIGVPENAFLTESLAALVSTSDYKDWSRIAAAYVLGFVPLSSASEHRRTLRNVLRNPVNSARVRTHVAEALGNLRDEQATPLLKQLLLNREEKTSVRRWCIYALSEIGSKESLHALNTFARTKPHGILAAEMGASSAACIEC